MDEEAWKSRVRDSVGAVRAAHGDHRFQRGVLQAVQGYYYLVNSEGTRLKVPRARCTFRRGPRRWPRTA